MQGVWVGRGAFVFSSHVSVWRWAEMMRWFTQVSFSRTADPHAANRAHSNAAALRAAAASPPLEHGVVELLHQALHVGKLLLLKR